MTPFHNLRDFIDIIIMHGSPYPFILLLGEINKINIPNYCRKILEYYSPPLPNVACPQATARIELESILSRHGVYDVLRNIFLMWILHPPSNNP